LFTVSKPNGEELSFLILLLIYEKNKHNRERERERERERRKNRKRKDSLIERRGEERRGAEKDSDRRVEGE